MDVVAAKLGKSTRNGLTELRDLLREMESPTEPSQPITAAEVEQMVTDLHALLSKRTRPSSRRSSGK